MWRLVWTVAVGAAWYWTAAAAGAAAATGGGEAELLQLVDSLAKEQEITVISGVTIRRLDNAMVDGDVGLGAGGGRQGVASTGDAVLDKLDTFTRTHVLDVRVPEVVRSARALIQNTPRFAFGKNSFLTGFGLGFLAFGLKKLLLPVFIGAQIVKSVLLAMFLPSIIGGIAKLMGKGLTSVAQGSSSSAHGAGQDTITDFDFKDTGAGGGGGGGYDSLGAGSDDNPGVWTYPPDNSARQPFPAYTSSGLGATSMALKQPQDRYQAVKYSYHDPAKHQGSFYSRDKQQDYKVFHGIPASSQLLANYDPFYSPLLSRLDAVFQQLGHRDEPCRERLVCHMYSNPAKFAPFSNLVSAQLSRELNELRKPSTDNPEILRFFRYMKAAKDGQDGADCERLYPGCAIPLDAPARAPMLTTYNDIDKLVHARKLSL